MEEKQMKTLGGYEIVDEKARQDIDIVAEKADEAYSLAKGATKAFVYDTYSDMVAELNALDKAELLVNFHVMIREVCVPDLWISGVSDEHVEYTYTSNEDFIADLTEDGIVQVGYFILSALETQKVDLSEYVKNTDYATKDKTGLVKTDFDFGLGLLADGKIYVRRAQEQDVDNKTNGYKPIVPNILDYAVKKALSDCKLTGGNAWTDEEKAKALELLGGVSKPVTPTSTSVIAIDTGGNIATLRYTTAPANWCIPLYDGSGNLKTNVPTEDSHATTKKYVDDLVGDVQTILTELHTYAQTKIGGEA